MDGLKELVEAFSARIKSPIIGSIALAFVIVNWKPLFFLLFSGEPAVAKFAFYDGNTTVCTLYLYPVIIGLAFALLLPRVNFWGAKAVEAPITKHRNMQSDAVHALADRKARQAIDTETVSTEYRSALLKSAEGLQEIKDADIDPDLRADLEEKVAKVKDFKQGTIIADKKPLSDTSKTFLTRAAKDLSGRVSFESYEGTYYVIFGRGGRSEHNQVSRKAFLEAKETGDQLVGSGYMEVSGGGSVDLTAKGYIYLDGLDGRKPKEK